MFQVINSLGPSSFAAHLHHRINLQDPRRQHAVGVSARPTQRGVPVKLDSHIALGSGVSVSPVLPFPAVPSAVSTYLSRKRILLKHLQTAFSFFTDRTVYGSTSLWQGCRWQTSMMVIRHHTGVQGRYGCSGVAGAVAPCCAQGQGSACTILRPRLRPHTCVAVLWVPSTTLLCSSTGVGSRHCPRPDLGNTAQGILLAMHLSERC